MGKRWREVSLRASFWWDSYRWFREHEGRTVWASMFWTYQREVHDRVPEDSDW
ncbi:hypothetical protein [Terracoccus sp. 273MFTsu3.1]|uniref:hypothetical protein n=1 Tax=Terracoccus sp. 273MFTsu3.1 TaxID=1172188 RepID=UPI00036F769E|nr:hypothetical protein [Terracoccus sp. 273MFTsu3.1]